MQKKKTAENPFLSLVFNIAIPSFILTKFSEAGSLGPKLAFLIALAFPVSYSLYDYSKRRSFSLIAGLGLISTVLGGLFNILELSANWVAVKEASVPSLIGFAILFSMRGNNPLVKQIVYNDSILNVSLIEERLKEHQNRELFDQRLKEASYLLAISFLFSAILNFVLAKYFLISPPGTPEYNAEFAKMNLTSWPVIALPSSAISMLALYRLLNGVKKLTGLPMDELLKTHEKAAPSK